MQIKPLFVDQNPNNSMRNNLFDIIEKIKALYQATDVSLKAFFRRIDLDSDDYISFKEFTDFLANKAKISPLSLTQVKECFKIFDDDHDNKISYFDFSQQFLNLDSIDPKKLLQRFKKKILEKNNDEKGILKQLFKSMDQHDKGYLSFIDFYETIIKLNINFKKTEIEVLYQNFDKDDNERISPENFVEVLSEDHLNLELLRINVFYYLNQKGLTLKHYFRSLNSKMNDDFLNRKEFSAFLNFFGYKDEFEQQEIFEAFDLDKDYFISFDEFNKIFSESKIKNSSESIPKLITEVDSDNHLKHLKTFNVNRPLGAPSKLQRGRGHSEYIFKNDDHQFKPEKTDFLLEDNLQRKPVDEKDFQPRELLKLLKKKTTNKGLSLFQWFIEHDYKKKYYLTSVEDLSTMINKKLELSDISMDHIKKIFDFYSQDKGKSMKFIRFLMDIEDPASVLIKLMKNFMNNKQIKLSDLFSLIDKDKDQTWDLKEFSLLINSILDVGMDKKEIMGIFKQWDINNSNCITLENLKTIFNSDNKSKVQELNDEKIKNLPWFSQTFEKKNIETLGKGAFGFVYRVQRLKDKKYFALKYMHFKSQEDFDNCDKEINIMRDLKMCGNIIHIEESHIEIKSSDVYIVMEIADKNLHEFLKEKKNKLNYELFLNKK